MIITALSRARVDDPIATERVRAVDITLYALTHRVACLTRDHIGHAITASDLSAVVVTRRALASIITSLFTLKKAITTAGALTCRGTPIRVDLITVIALLTPLLDHEVSAGRSNAAVKTAIAHLEVPIITLFSAVYLSITTPTTNWRLRAPLTR